MAKINLKNYYPFQKNDIIIDVPDEVAEAFCEFERLEAAYQRRLYRHKAHYSLDRDDGAEYDALFISLSPYEIYERKVTYEQLHAAITRLPDKQAKRIYAHYFLGMSKIAIAKSEGVSEGTIREAISRGLRNIEKNLKKFS